MSSYRTRDVNSVPKGVPLEADARHRLARLVAELGETQVANEIGLSPQTLGRVMAGLTVYGCTVGAVRGYLERTARG